MPKRIVLCFDGTWNTPDDDGEINGDRNTNVVKIAQAAASSAPDGMRQVVWYDEGVGTEWFNRFKGGIFGVGLSRNIQEGYRKLVELYEDGDEIFVFGFSRGAYSARSLVGLIRNSGLLRREHEDMVADAYALYRMRDEGADGPSAQFFRGAFSRPVEIKCLGVWDTVGALGIPVQSFEWFSRRHYEFHDTELSGIVKNAFHALAVDEHREDYVATLWDPKEKPGQTMEQVWFVGAHANVGGGYPERELSDITLAWMMEKAEGCGLAFDDGSKPEISDETYRAATIRDSYSEFLKGRYSRFKPRFFRQLGFCCFGNEAIHDSVHARRDADPHYRPKNRIGSYITSSKDHSSGRL